MSQYATTDEFENHLGPTLLAQLSSDDATADDAVLAGVLVDASGFIDGYLGGRYEIPVTDAEALAILRPHCLVIAKQYLIERRLGGRYDSGSVEIFNATIGWLRRVSEGKASLSGAAPRVDPDVVAAGASYGSDTLVFGDPNDPDSGNTGAML